VIALTPGSVIKRRASSSLSRVGGHDLVEPLELVLDEIDLAPARLDAEALI
jgi:hypothetical protein